MVIITNLQFKDVFRFNLQLANSHYNWFKQLRDTALVFGAAFAWGFLSRSPTTQTEWTAVLTSAIWFALIFKLMWFVITPALAAIAAVKSKSLGIHEFRFETEAIHEKNGSGELITNWNQTLKVIALTDYVAIQVGTVSYHIIPASAFSSPDDFHKLKTELLALHEQSSAYGT
ncbi:MAG: YcxB family protein [Rhodoferax sp.]|nr:MAG: YcxB family protein [Rhodoferax sp.]